MLDYAFVAQGIERLVAVQKVAGPIPAERTRKHPQVPLDLGVFSCLLKRQESEPKVRARGTSTVKNSAKRCAKRKSLPALP